jgi:uncharacterized membrane-anchored protein YitT (DUF2179 family)
MKDTKAAAFYNWMYVIVGSVLTALAYNLFFIPNNIAPGGISGLATELHALIHVPVGATIAVINIPLFLIGWKIRGHVFMLRTLAATLLLSLLIDIVHFPDSIYKIFADDILLATVYGGIMMGAGVGLTIRGNATSGGTDLIAIIGNHYMPSVDIAWVLFGVDFLVVAAAAVIFEPKAALYALAAVFIGSRIVDFIQTGARSAKVLYIISKKSEIITKRILLSLNRGVTILQGRGAFSGKDHDVLFCIVAPAQITPMKKLISEEDPDAFVVVSDVKEVLGEGFAPHSGR